MKKDYGLFLTLASLFSMFFLTMFFETFDRGLAEVILAISVICVVIGLAISYSFEE